MSLVWRFKKQSSYLILAAAVAALAVYLIYLGVKPASSCFDAKKNQNEEGIDCGGVCVIACSFNVESLNILWTRPFEVRLVLTMSPLLLAIPTLFWPLPRSFIDLKFMTPTIFS